MWSSCGTARHAVPADVFVALGIQVIIDLTIGTDTGHRATCGVLLHVVACIFDDKLAAMLEEIGCHLGECGGSDRSLNCGIDLGPIVPEAGITNGGSAWERSDIV